MNTPDTWRYIPPIAASGQVQMAIDRWLFNQHCLGLHPPTLRFYTWSPAAISLGYHQSKFPATWRELTWNDQPIDLIRRPSGGRAVLHQGDLTYAAIASGFSTNRAEAYAGWRSLSVPLHFGRTERNYIHNPNCFGTATNADLITEDGTKLIGSAQLRQGNAILQHGSMRLNADPALFQKIFEQPLNAVLITISQQVIIDALIDSAQNSFNIHLTTQPLSQKEWHDINALAQTSCHPGDA
jgi:lipoate---protein ligase